MTARNSFGTVTRSVVITVITPINAEFKVEMVAKRGRGYSAAERNKTGDEAIGMVAVDALFSPVDFLHDFHNLCGKPRYFHQASRDFCADD